MKPARSDPALPPTDRLGSEVARLLGGLLDVFDHPAWLMDGDLRVWARNRAADASGLPAWAPPCAAGCAPWADGQGCPVETASRTGRFAESVRNNGGRMVRAWARPTGLQGPTGARLLVHGVELLRAEAPVPEALLHATHHLIARMMRITEDAGPLRHRARLGLEALLEHPSLGTVRAAGCWVLQDGRLRLLAAVSNGMRIPGACREVPRGECHCGRAAEGSVIEEPTCGSSRADGPATPHAHVVRPLLLQGRIHGVLNLYFDAGHRPAGEERFAIAAATHGFTMMVARAQAQRELIETEQRFARIFDSVPIPLLLFDEAGRLQAHDPAATQVLGVGRTVPDEVVLRRLASGIAQDLTGFVDRLRRERVIGDHRLTWRVDRDARRELAVDYRWVHIGSRPEILVAARDITPLLEAQARLVQNSHLTALGTRSAAVAHELRQPLGFALANVEFAEEELAAPGTADSGLPASRIPDVRAALGDALAGLARAKGILRDIRNLTRMADRSIHAIDVNEAVQAAITVGGPDARRVARLEVDLATDLPPVPANMGWLGQVVLNLLENAVRAVEVREADTRLVKVCTRATEDAVHIVVGDNGPGVPPEDRDLIFQPFVTRHAEQGGTGLGLWICRDLVARMHGVLHVEDTPGGGATFVVRLPIPPAGGEHATKRRPDPPR